MNLGCVTGVSPTNLAAVYLQVWSKSTLHVYGPAYCDIRYGEVMGKHWYRWLSRYLIPLHRIVWSDWTWMTGFGWAQVQDVCWTQVLCTIVIFMTQPQTYC